MKRKTSLFTVLLALVLVFSLAACTGANVQTSSSAPAAPSAAGSAPSEAASETNSDSSDAVVSDVTDSSAVTDTQSGGGNTLIAYFSKTGNTATVAETIADITGGDLFAVDPAVAYPESYDETVEIAADELENDARPELATHVEDMSQYDVIYIGYPIWWGHMPMAMFTFMEKYDLSGKTIIPFATHAGSALGQSMDDITSLAPNATILEGFSVSGSRAADARADIEAWIAGLGL